MDSFERLHKIQTQNDIQRIRNFGCGEACQECQQSQIEAHVISRASAVINNHEFRSHTISLANVASELPAMPQPKLRQQYVPGANFSNPFAITNNHILTILWESHSCT